MHANIHKKCSKYANKNAKHEKKMDNIQNQKLWNIQKNKLLNVKKKKINFQKYYNYKKLSNYNLI